MRPSRIVWLVVALASALAGCGDDEPPTRADRGRGPFTGVAVSTAPAPTDVPGARHRQDFDTLDHDSIAHAHAPTAAGGTPAPPPSLADTAATPEQRNLGGELATALGSPATCIDIATARTLHGRLTMQVTATVTPTGTVTRATASGASLPEATLACMQARALTAHLAAPVPGAPRTISTSLSFDVTTTDDTTTRETPEWHQPGAVASPGVVLPAVGAQGRPVGAVTPDSTLPAVGAAGRPEGSVRPDIVTPAQGGGGTLWPSGAPPPPPTSTTTR